jgi:hypothetical protein
MGTSIIEQQQGRGNGKAIQEPDTIILNASEILMVATSGVYQNLYNWDKKAKPRYGAGRNNDWQYTIEGMLGHYAFCKFMGVFFDANMGNYKAVDVAWKYQIRTSPHPYLVLHPPDNDNDIFVSVYGVNGRYKIAGWIYGNEGKIVENWADLFKNGRPAYWVRHDKLRSMSTLP